MTASRADRIEAQVDRLTEIVDRLAAREFIVDQIFKSGYAAGQEAATPWFKSASTPSKPVVKSHLSVVR